VRRVVKERKEWKKFGEVESVEKGKHKLGDYIQESEMKIHTLDGSVKDEIDLAFMIKNITQDKVKLNREKR